MTDQRQCSWEGCEEPARPGQRYCKHHHAVSSRACRQRRRAELEAYKAREAERSAHEHRPAAKSA